MVGCWDTKYVAKGSASRGHRRELIVLGSGAGAGGGKHCFEMNSLPMRHDQSTTRAMANFASWCKLRGNCWYLPLCIRSQDCRSAGCLIRSINPSPIELPPCFIDATWLANCPPIWLRSEEPAPLPLSGTCGRYLEKCFAEHAIACMFGCSGHPHAGTAHQSDQRIISVCAVSHSTMDLPSMRGCAETLSKLPKVITPNPHPITKKRFVVPRMLPS